MIMDLDGPVEVGENAQIIVYRCTPKYIADD
jgi:hypothetical protein